MGQQIELDRAERAVKDAEIRLHTIQSQLDIIELESARLTYIGIQLEHNISALKKDKIVALAGQYKRIKAELLKVNSHLNIVNNNKAAVTKMRNEAIVLVKKCKKDYEDLVDSFKNNVIFGNFGKRIKSG